MRRTGHPTRYTHKVDTKGFIQLAAFEETDHPIMRESYGLCSTWEHHQPSAAHSPAPSPDVIAAEIEKLSAWHAQILDRQSKLKPC